jgi:hypothetical protein
MLGLNDLAFPKEGKTDGSNAAALHDAVPGRFANGGQASHR